VIEIPLFQNISADFLQTIKLGNQLVNLRFVWNVRNSFFHLDVIPSLGGSLTGIKVVPRYPLLSQFSGQIEFRGDFLVLKTDNSLGSLITYENFGQGWDLFYVDRSELITWRVENGLR
jgi:hypothetical protein